MRFPPGRRCRCRARTQRSWPPVWPAQAQSSHPSAGLARPVQSGANHSTEIFLIDLDMIRPQTATIRPHTGTLETNKAQAKSFRPRTKSRRHRLAEKAAPRGLLHDQRPARGKTWTGPYIKIYSSSARQFTGLGSRRPDSRSRALWRMSVTRVIPERGERVRMLVLFQNWVRGEIFPSRLANQVTLPAPGVVEIPASS